MFSALDHFLFGWVPWELWLLIGVAGAIAALLCIPGKLGGLVAAGVLALTVSTTSYDRGEHEGIDHERSAWETKILQERQRLTEEFGKQLTAERTRADQAEKAKADADKELEDALQFAKSQPGADSTVAIPESVAVRLCSLAPGGCDGTPQRPRGHSRSANPLRRLLQRGG